MDQRRNTHGTIDAYIDWCPTKELDIGTDGPKIYKATKDDYEYIAARIFAKFNVKLQLLDCIARSDGILLMLFSYLEKSDDVLEARNLRIERYAMNKFKESLLNHEHIFHNSSISNTPSHNPVLISNESLNKELFSLGIESLRSVNFIRMSHEERYMELEKIAIEDSCIGSLLAAGKNRNPSNLNALELIFSFILGKSFEAKNSIKEFLSSQKVSSKKLNAERRNAIKIVCTLAVSMLFVSTALDFKIGKIFSVSSFAALAAYISLLEWRHQTNFFRGSHKISAHVVGYAQSARYYSALLTYIFANQCDNERRYALREGKISYTLNALEEIRRELDSRVERRRYNLLLQIAAIGAAGAIAGFAATI